MVGYGMMTRPGYLFFAVLVLGGCEGLVDLWIDITMLIKRQLITVLRKLLFLSISVPL